MQTSASSTAVSRKRPSSAREKRCSRCSSLHSAELLGPSLTRATSMAALQALWKPTPQAAGSARSSLEKCQGRPNSCTGGIAAQFTCR
jgi:hypothetical protein